MLPEAALSVDPDDAPVVNVAVPVNTPVLGPVSVSVTETPVESLVEVRVADKVSGADALELRSMSLTI